MEHRLCCSCTGNYSQLDSLIRFKERDERAGNKLRNGKVEFSK